MMESPIKQPVFTTENKENAINDKIANDEIAVPVKGIPMLDEPEAEPVQPSAAPAIKGEEAVEPILQENAQRFVLFPIKYHEVCTYKTLSCHSNTIHGHPL